MAIKIERVKYGIVRECSEGTLYIMKPAPGRKGWAEEVAHHVGGPVSDPKSWRLSMGAKYMVLIGDVDTSISDGLKKFLLEIK